jgi:hypothetical protein
MLSLGPQHGARKRDLQEDLQQKREGKRRKLRRRLLLMYLLYKNAYRIFKPVEIRIRRGLRQKEKQRR